VVQNDYCYSGKCALLCVQCLSEQDCPSQEFCIAGACAPQVGIGTPCLGVSCLALEPCTLTSSLSIAYVWHIGSQCFAASCTRACAYFLAPVPTQRDIITALSLPILNPYRSAR
jgi:hypothetical protein